MNSQVPPYCAWPMPQKVFHAEIVRERIAASNCKCARCLDAEQEERNKAALRIAQGMKWILGEVK